MRWQNLIFLILLISLGVSLYFLYLAVLDYYAEPISLVKQRYNNAINASVPSYTGERQFYPNMRFNHNSISYFIREECDESKREKMLEAMDFLSEKISLLIFQQTEENNADILVSCNEKEKERGMFIAGEGGPTSIVNSSLFYVIGKGKIVLFYKESCSYNIELHELLHVLGFDHSTNKNSIMYNVTNCNQILTDDIIDELKRLYSISPLPDLYFSDVNATKKGIYLNININVKNQGLIAAENVKVLIYADNKKVESFDFNIIDYGAGKSLQAENLRLPSRSIDSLRVVIEGGNEISLENNEIKLVIQT